MANRRAGGAQACNARQRPPELIVLPETEGFPALPFLLIRDDCRTLRIRVRPDGAVEVKIPQRVSSAEAMRTVECKRTWIEGKRDFFRGRPQPAQHHYKAGEPFYYLGRPFLLRLEEKTSLAPLTSPSVSAPTARLPLAQLQGNELVVRGAALTPVRIQRAIELWRNRLEQRLFVHRLHRLHHRACQELGDLFPLPTLRLRALKRRWGSCSRRKLVASAALYEVTLARQLSATPLESIDYVILHELCHMRHMDHGPLFHALLRRLLPNATARSRRLHLWNIEHPKD